MEQELIPLSEAKTRLHHVVRDLEGRDVVLVRYGRPVGVLLGFRRYRELISRTQHEAGRPRESRIRADLLGARRGELARICRSRRVRRLILFGSTARGDEYPASDIDLLVEFAPISPRERAEALFGLQDDLERLFGRAVDLVEEDAIRNPYLRESIEKSHEVLYEAA